MSRAIRIHEDTWRRLQALGESFADSPLGTPNKVIEMLLDAYEEDNAPPDANSLEVARDGATV